jgi:translation initiation factor eIF-2B subunit epsilon
LYQAFCVQNDAYGAWFGIILRSTYEADLLSEEDLIEWRSLSAAKGEGAKESERGKWAEVFKKGKVYVDVLEQMESDDDEDEDNDEDGD